MFCAFASSSSVTIEILTFSLWKLVFLHVNWCMLSRVTPTLKSATSCVSWCFMSCRYVPVSTEILSGQGEMSIPAHFSCKMSLLCAVALLWNNQKKELLHHLVVALHTLCNASISSLCFTQRLLLSDTLFPVEPKRKSTESQKSPSTPNSNWTIWLVVCHSNRKQTFKGWTSNWNSHAASMY